MLRVHAAKAVLYIDELGCREQDKVQRLYHYRNELGILID